MWIDEDEEGILYPHEDVLVIKITAANKKFYWILVDMISSVDILFKSTLEEMGIADLRLEHTNNSLKGFGGGKLVLLGVVELPITIGISPIENTPVVKRARIRQVPIMWTDEDEEGILYPHEDALAIKATAASKKFD